jgi:hypothetical protein
MEKMNMSENGYIGYEYKDVTVKRSMEAIYADNYPQFGWKLESILTTVNPYYVTMKFKRDRKIRNKVELTRLQRMFESYVREIDRLEKSKVVAASTVAYVIGVVGTGFMAGAVFSYLANMIPLSIILAILGFAGWILPYFCFLRIRDKKTSEVSPVIDQQYGAIYAVCEKANSLLSE